MVNVCNFSSYCVHRKLNCCEQNQFFHEAFIHLLLFFLIFYFCTLLKNLLKLVQPSAHFILSFLLIEDSRINQPDRTSYLRQDNWASYGSIHLVYEISPDNFKKLHSQTRGMCLRLLWEGRAGDGHRQRLHQLWMSYTSLNSEILSNT
jgi:hypothetical protein